MVGADTSILRIASASSRYTCCDRALGVSCYPPPKACQHLRFKDSRETCFPPPRPPKLTKALEDVPPTLVVCRMSGGQAQHLQYTGPLAVSLLGTPVRCELSLKGTGGDLHPAV